MKFDLISEYHKLKENGVNIINLGIGEVGFEMPREIKLFSSKICLSSEMRYTSEKGIQRLRTKLADYVNRKFGYKGTYENILVTNGARQALFDVLFTIIENNDDEVIVVRPAWFGYEDMIKSLNGRVKSVTLEKKNDFFISADRIISEMNKNTKAIIINTPGNPFGNKVVKDELEKLIAASCMYDIKLILDIVYQDCGLYDDSIDLKAFSLDQLRNVVLIDSFSKRYAMSGWRIGYLVATNDLVEKAAQIQKLVTNNVNTLSQYALLMDFNERDYIKKRQNILITNYEWLKSFYKNHNYIELLNDSPNIYYSCIKLKGIKSMEYIDFAEKLLHEFNVLVTPYKSDEECFIRISFACPINILKEGVNHIDECYNKYYKLR